MKRRYDNSGRRAQAARTRQRIVDAAIDVIGRPGARFVMSAVARRAGVALPTVYKHFRTRPALLRAIRDRVDQTSARPPVSRSPSELRDSVPQLHAFFNAREPIIRAITHHAELASLRDAAFRARDAGIQRALRPVTAHLSEEEEVAVRALLVRIMAAPAWLELKDEHRLSDAVVTRMTSWAVGALLKRLEADAVRASRSPHPHHPLR